LSTSNRLTFEDMCPILLKAFQSLSKGLLVYCSYLREYVYVDGDIFLLPGDNERSAQYSSTSTSCDRFCRFGDCTRKDLFIEGSKRNFSQTMATALLIEYKKSKNLPTPEVTEKGISPSGVYGYPKHLDVHRDTVLDVLHTSKQGLAPTYLKDLTIYLKKKRLLEIFS